MRQRHRRKNEIVRHIRVSKVSYCAMHEKSIENESKKNWIIIIIYYYYFFIKNETQIKRSTKD